MLDLALNSNSHDLILKDGDFLFIDDATRIAQQIKIRLWTFLGEWFLDTTHGVPYLERVLVKNPSLGLVKSIFISHILAIKDVEKVETISLLYNAKTRTLTIDYTAMTAYGLITKKEVLGYE